jgi:MFS family permease
MGTLPFGIVAGFCTTALPFILANVGMTVDRIAVVSAAAASPTVWIFIFTPAVDTGATRRLYAFVWAAISALSLGTALLTFSPTRLSLFSALVMSAMFSIVMQTSAVSGWTSEFVPDRERGRVSGWINVANLGGGAAAAMLVMELSRTVSLGVLAGIVSALLAVSTLFLLAVPPPVRPVIPLTDVVRGTFRSVAQTSRRPDVVVGFALFLAPASAVAAINLFASLGGDFDATPGSVVWVTGAGAALAASFGALAGGYLADRTNRLTLYLTAGILAGACSLTMASLPHVQATFVAGVVVYNIAAGMCYAAFNALGLQLVGASNATASTQLALFAAAANAALTYMTWFDGEGYRLAGVSGLLRVDGVTSMTAAMILLGVLGGRRRRRNLRSSAAPVK